jgi:hypothetical protein
MVVEESKFVNAGINMKILKKICTKVTYGMLEIMD